MARLSQLSCSITGRVACVTGAASGIGRATARLFADEGARLAVVDQNADGAAATAAEITQAATGRIRLGKSEDIRSFLPAREPGQVVG